MRHLACPRLNFREPYQKDVPLPCLWGANFSQPTSLKGLTIITDDDLRVDPADEVLTYYKRVFFKGKELSDNEQCNLIMKVLNPMYFGTDDAMKALKVAEEKGIKGWFFPATVVGGMIGKYGRYAALVACTIVVLDKPPTKKARRK